MNRPILTNATHSNRNHWTKRQAMRLIVLNAIIVACFASLCLFMSTASDAPSPVVAASSQSEQSAIAQARAAYGQLPLSFEVNRGQADKAVNYLVRGADVFMTKFNPAGSALVYSTYLGGTNDDRREGLASTRPATLTSLAARVRPIFRRSTPFRELLAARPLLSATPS